MLEKAIENNRVSLIGTVVSEFRFSHEIKGEEFYFLDIEIKRLSGNKDIIPLMISDCLVNIHKDCRGQTIQLSGQFRSYNVTGSTKRHSILFVFVREFRFIEETVDFTNQIYLEGTICKRPVYRITPLGREITELLLEVSRSCQKSDYIPCIAWGRNARYAASFEVGTQVRVWGRIQNREYTKKLSETECAKRTAYEVSLSQLEMCN